MILYAVICSRYARYNRCFFRRVIMWDGLGLVTVQGVEGITGKTERTECMIPVKMLSMFNIIL